MRRGIFSVLRAVSLALLIAVAGLWVWSWLAPGYLRIIRSTQRRVFVGVGNGTLSLSESLITTPATARWAVPLAGLALSDQVSLFAVQPDPGGQTAVMTIGSGQIQLCWGLSARLTAAPRMTLLDSTGVPVTVQLQVRQLDVGLHWLLLVFAILPLIHWRRTRFPPPGFCKNCGYDLRATPDRCPECGLSPSSRPRFPVANEKRPGESAGPQGLI